MSLCLDTVGLSLCSVTNPPFMDRCHFSSTHSPTPMCIDHSPPRDQCWGYRILDQKKKKRKNNTYHSLLEIHNGKQRAIVTQNASWFLSNWSFLEKKLIHVHTWQRITSQTLRIISQLLHRPRRPCDERQGRRKKNNFGAKLEKMNYFPARGRGGEQ